MTKTASGLSLRQLKGNPGAQLAAAKDLPEVLDFVDLAAAAKALAQTREQKLYAEEWHLRGQRKAGALLGETAMFKGGRGKTDSTLESLSIEPHESMRWQAVAAVPVTSFEAYIEAGRSDGGDITRAGLLRYSRLAPLMSSAEEDWHTPPEVINATLELFDVIDLDPCSNEGRPNIPAKRHYRPGDDGLTKTWRGRIYMNPPYGRVIESWVAKLLEEHLAGRTSEAIALLPSRTDTAWFRLLRDYPRCFVSGRLRFSDSDPAPFPSVAVYLGGRLTEFVSAFEELGDVYKRVA